MRADNVRMRIGPSDKLARLPTQALTAEEPPVPAPPPRLRDRIGAARRAALAQAKADANQGISTTFEYLGKGALLVGGISAVVGAVQGAIHGFRSA